MPQRHVVPGTERAWPREDARAGDRAMARLSRRRRRALHRIALASMLVEHGRGQPWHYFLTQTFRPELGFGAWPKKETLRWYAQRSVWLKGTRKLGAGFFALEAHKSGEPHIHGLVSLREPPGAHTWRGLRHILEAYGWSRVRPFRTNVQGEHYVVKQAALYSAKKEGAWILEEYIGEGEGHTEGPFHAVQGALCQP